MIINVGICCNDDYGRTDALRQLSIGNCETLYICGDIEDGEEISISGMVPEIELAIGGKAYWAKSHSCWVGNTYWDEVEMDIEEAVRLVNDLLALPHWSFQNAECSLAEVIEESGAITVELLKAALS